jgi:spore maturation protein SpmB
VGFLVAIGIFIESGSMDFILGGLAWALALTGVNTDFVDALPVAFLKPMSGGNARAMMWTIIEEHGADTFTGRLASIFRGCTETTVYILAVYFGSVGIRKSRHALVCGLLADFVGIIAGILVAYLFFH